MKIKSFHIILILLLLFSSCRKDKDILDQLIFQGFDYAPLKLGQAAIYNIDTIRYNEFTSQFDTTRFQQKELVKREVLDGENRSAFNIEVYNRVNDSSTWNLIKVIRKTKTNSRLEKLDDNILSVDLIFPISEGESWNMNNLNANDELVVKYKNVNSFFINEVISFDSTITISIREESNLIEQIFTEAIYGINNGLVYRKDRNVRTKLNGKIESGYEATIQLISFSK